MNKQKSKLHPKMFLLLIGLGSIIMSFAGLTSAIIVRKAQGNWLPYKMPDLFIWSTVVILASSATIFFAQRAFKKDHQQQYRLLMGITLVLGTLFLALQYFGWQELTSYGVLLNGNPSGAFLYVVSGLHFAHVIGGVILLLLFFLKSLGKRDAVQKLMDEINPDRGLGLTMMSTYWHFVDVLWLYLYGFFLIQI
ncbi:MAG: cytochrome c oxidase subunit 3 [Chitinophagales bacterium]